MNFITNFHLKSTNLLLILFILVIATSCAFMKPKDIATHEDMLAHYTFVKDCMGIEEDVARPKVEIVKDQDYVICNGSKLKDCYDKETMTAILPEFSNETNVRHVFVHHFKWVLEGDVDKEHESEDFLRCTGAALIQDGFENDIK